MTQEDVIARLEKAGTTLLSLPSGLSLSSDLVQPQVIAAARVISRRLDPSIVPAPSREDIVMMGETFAWLGLIGALQYSVRKIVAARSLVHPVTGKHLFSWHKIAAMVESDGKAVRRLHLVGIKTICEKLP